MAIWFMYDNYSPSCIGCGTLWQYGKNIFANKADAEAGVVKTHQKYHKERAATEAHQAEQSERRRARHAGTAAPKREVRGRRSC